MRTRASCLIALGVILGGCGTASIHPSGANAQDPSRFSYTRIHCTPDNESHFETVTVDLPRLNVAPPAPHFFVRGSQATRMALAGFDAGWGAQDLQARKFHAAPFAQYVVYLDGVMSVSTSDGETRQFGPGDVLRVDDVAPCKGHISVVGDRPAKTMIVRLPQRPSRIAVRGVAETDARSVLIDRFVPNPS